MTSRTHVEVEHFVRNRLYGERSDVRAVRVAETAVPGGASTQLLGERYRLVGLIGAGGMTNVYCARDELLKRRVAVKILAEPLAWRPSPPTRDQAIRIVAQIAEALTFAHEHDVVHGDVSPGNVLISRSDRTAKLTDFGLACKAGEKAPSFGGDVAGTYGYILPEMLRAEPVTALSDLYWLGALAYRLLVGMPERRTPVAAALPAGVADVIDSALEHDPAARPSSVADFRAQLLAAQGSPSLVQSQAA